MNEDPIQPPKPLEGTHLAVSLTAGNPWWEQEGYESFKHMVRERCARRGIEATFLIAMMNRERDGSLELRLPGCQCGCHVIVVTRGEIAEIEKEPQSHICQLRIQDWCNHFWNHLAAKGRDVLMSGKSKMGDAAEQD